MTGIVIGRIWKVVAKEERAEFLIAPKIATITGKTIIKNIKITPKKFIFVANSFICICIPKDVSSAISFITVLKEPPIFIALIICKIDFFS